MVTRDPGALVEYVGLRRLTEADADGVVSLYNSVYPYRKLHVEAWRLDDRKFDESRYPRRRWLAVSTITEEVIGYGCVWNTLAPRKYRLDVLVRPDWRRRGVGSRLLEELIVELQALAAVSLQARARDDETYALAFLEHHGFVEIHRMVYVRLDLANANPGAFRPLVERILASGVSVSTLAAEQARDPHCWAKLHSLHDAARLGWPNPDPDPDAGPLAPQPYHEFEQMLWGLNPIPEAFFIACSQDQYLGYSGLAPNPQDPGCLYSANTAVRPEVRGKGIATALKVCTVEYAKQHGHAAIQTSSANPAMIAVNEKLGFQRVWSEVRVVKQL
mgnify:CR=1 FL=1